ncbi:hypothetical protein MA16_Dca022991 [Dendrobium catenatum]|uniref:Uncharacterized protein n=1 Tax=Dendrobium catenatum TaxID=906689 RepID=A0A2I0XAM8_9ASPA|nr:hypothetical protein MA16_Dca022991 [Dendrobium catenatum]
MRLVQLGHGSTDECRRMEVDNVEQVLSCDAGLGVREWSSSSFENPKFSFSSGPFGFLALFGASALAWMSPSNAWGKASSPTHGKRRGFFELDDNASFKSPTSSFKDVLSGSPMQVGSRPSVARILVELHITKHYPYKVWIGPERLGYFQSVVMEDFPSFCDHCKVIGHACCDCLKLIHRVDVGSRSNAGVGIAVLGANENAGVNVNYVVSGDDCGIEVLDTSVNAVVTDHVSDIEPVVGAKLPEMGVVGAMDNANLIVSLAVDSSMQVCEDVVVGMLPPCKVVGAVSNPSVVPTVFIECSEVPPVAVDLVVSVVPTVSSPVASPTVLNARLVPSEVVDVHVKLIEPHALVYHVGEHSGMDVRGGLDWLQCSSEYESGSASSFESDGVVDHGKDFLRDRPIVSRGKARGRGRRGR